MICLTDIQKIYISCSVVAGLLLLFLFFIFFYKTIFAKKNYKFDTYLILSKFAMRNDYLLLNNYKIDFDDNHVGYIDHILISKKYIFAINDFPISGVVSGELKGRSLQVVEKKNNVQYINNPLNYNINLVKRFNLFNNLDQSFVKGVVAINNDSAISIKDTSGQFCMMKRKELTKFIRNWENSEEKDFNEDSIIKFINKLNKENQ